MDNFCKKPEIILRTFATPLALKQMFGNDRPVWLEIGFGVGKFFIELAQQHRDINLLGIEQEWFRYTRLQKKIQVGSIDNTLVICTDAPLAIRYLIPDNSLDRLFINFPDPWPKSRHSKNRLFALEFIDELHRCMKPGSCVRILTDVAEYAQVIRRSMLLKDLFTLDHEHPHDSYPTTTFQDRFSKEAIPYYPQTFITQKT